MSNMPTTSPALLEIDADLQAWIDPLSPEEHALLEASILAEGCRDPLVVWGGYLLDGHNRYAICQKHGIPFQTFEKTGLRTKEDVKIWMIENQLGKRNTTDFGRTALALKLKPLLEARARARQATSTGGTEPQLRPNSDEAGKRTDDAVAKLAGVGRDTVRKVEKIIEMASPEVVAQVRAGEISIHAATKTLASKVEPAPPANLSETTASEIRTKSARAAQADRQDDAPDLAQLADELQKENEAYQRQIQSLDADDPKAELVRLNQHLDQLNGRLQGEINTRNEAQKMVKHYAAILEKIRKALNVENNRDILAALGAR